MAYRANQAFTTWVGGFKRNFKKDAIVPDEIAAKVLALTYGDASGSPPASKRAAKKNTTARDVVIGAVIGSALSD